MPIGFVWQNFFIAPLINFLVALSALTFGSFGLAILVFTVLTRLVTFPLTLRTLRATRRMQEIQPQLQQIQKKYSDPRRRSEETMKLYRESGVNPLGCLGPQLLQMPIFIAMYRVIRITLGSTPEGVLYLHTSLYNFDLVQNAAPLSTRFLFIDLGASGYNPSSIMLMLIVFAAMWLQQRISAGRNPAADSQQQQMSQMMQWFMPALFAWFVVVVPAGLGLYWASTTVIGIVLQWVFIGPGDFTWASLIPEPIRTRRGAPPRVAARPAIQPATASAANEARSNDDEQQQQRSGDQRRRRRRRDRSRPQATRPQSQSGRRRRRPRR